MDLKSTILHPNKYIRHLFWIYYGQILISLAICYVFSRGICEPIDPLSELGTNVQYIIIFDALITIPLGLYLIKWRKPQTEEHYFKLAAMRILLVSNTMPLGTIAFYWMGCYKSMIWVAAIAAIAWLFSKPSLAKMEKEMTPEDPNMPTY